MILEKLSRIYGLTISYASDNPQKRHKEDISVRSFLLKTLIENINDKKIIFNQKISSRWAIESVKKCKYIYKSNKLDFVIGSDLISDIFSWKDFDNLIKEAGIFIIKRNGYPVKSTTLKMLEKYNVKFKVSTLNIPNISSSMVRLNNNYSDLPKSLIDIVKKNNLYVPTKIVE